MKKLVFASTVAAIAACAAAAPVRAADDGQASLVTGIATTFGLTKDDKPNIEYRERSKLVVPRNRNLPPPGSGGMKDAAWPTNVETVREKRRKEMEDAGPSARDYADRNYQLVRPGDKVVVTTSGFNGQRGSSCRVPDPKTGECPDTPHAGINWNPLTWVGIQKKPDLELTAEPERQTLVDPPKGWRAPAEGVGAKVEDK